MFSVIFEALHLAQLGLSSARLAGWLIGWPSIRQTAGKHVNFLKITVGSIIRLFAFFKNRNQCYFNSTNTFMAGFLEKYFSKVVAWVRIFCGSHMKPGQSLLYSTTVLYNIYIYMLLHRSAVKASWSLTTV